MPKDPRDNKDHKEPGWWGQGEGNKVEDDTVRPWPCQGVLTLAQV